MQKTSRFSSKSYPRTSCTNLPACGFTAFLWVHRSGTAFHSQPPILQILGAAERRAPPCQCKSKRYAGVLVIVCIYIYIYIFVFLYIYISLSLSLFLFFLSLSFSFFFFLSLSLSLSLVLFSFLFLSLSLSLSAIFSPHRNTRCSNSKLCVAMQHSLVFWLCLLFQSIRKDWKKVKFLKPTTFALRRFWSGKEGRSPRSWRSLVQKVQRANFLVAPSAGPPVESWEFNRARGSGRLSWPLSHFFCACFRGISDTVAPPSRGWAS